MFTGIVEEIGGIKALSRNDKGARITIECRKVLEGTLVGDSIAVNGVCLTVTQLGIDSFTADVMNETIIKSNIGKIKVGTEVNLERAMNLTSRLGGGIVTGHIDGVGRISNKQSIGNSVIYKITTSKEICRLIVPKGSITIEGANLTIVDVEENYFTISLIPHTLGITTLGTKEVGDFVNLENDIISKYVAKLISKENRIGSNITLDFLAKNGF